MRASSKAPVCERASAGLASASDHPKQRGEVHACGRARLQRCCNTPPPAAAACAGAGERRRVASACPTAPSSPTLHASAAAPAGMADSAAAAAASPPPPWQPPRRPPQVDGTLPPLVYALSELFRCGCLLPASRQGALHATSAGDATLCAAARPRLASGVAPCSSPVSPVVLKSLGRLLPPPRPQLPACL